MIGSEIEALTTSVQLDDGSPTGEDLRDGGTTSGRTDFHDFGHAEVMKAAELGDFLRSRRERIDPTTVGLPGGTNRRTAGLRREEVAVLAGVGVSWLTRLEQGRANNVSTEVLGGLANALRLSGTEIAHLYTLAAVRLPTEAVDVALTPALQRLVDSLNPNPAYLLDHNWNLVAWNTSEEELFPVLTTAGSSPNLLRLFLEHPEIREFIADWPSEVERLTRQFRAHVTEFPDERLDALSAELRAEHGEFARAWDRHDVAPLAPKARVINHPSGQRSFDQHRLALPDHPGWQLVLFVPK